MMGGGGVSNNLLTIIYDLIALIHGNAWTITISLVVAYFVKSKVIDPFLHERERKTSYAEASNPARVSMLHARMMEVRAVQQEEATHKAIAAKAAAEAKRILEMERKRIEQPNQRGGRRLGGGGGQTTRSSNAAGENNPWNSQGDGGRRDYDPLNPNSGHSRGYRPARRTVRRS